MGIFNKSEEERAASQQAKTEREKAKAERKFARSPIGKARQAFADGDRYFEVEIPHSQLKSYVAPMMRPGTMSLPANAKGADTLGRISAEGWRLFQAGWVFVQEGQESRDRFMASGQQVAISGEVVGIYLFERDGQASQVQVEADAP